MIFNQTQNICVKRHHLLQIVDVQDNMTQSFDFQHGNLLSGTAISVYAISIDLSMSARGANFVQWPGENIS
jgi:hypothetical protein